VRRQEEVEQEGVWPEQVWEWRGDRERSQRRPTGKEKAWAENGLEGRMGEMSGRESCGWGSGGRRASYSVLRVWSQPGRGVKLDSSFSPQPG
jgi:hypothetical protein